MSDMKLVIGSKGNCTWSFRTWLLMKQLNIPFIEYFDVPRDELVARSGLELIQNENCLPILIDGSVLAWEAMAIIEYLNEKFPNRDIWPEQPSVRAEARSIATEIDVGFTALRHYAPVEFGQSAPNAGHGPGVQHDVGRVLEIWHSCRERYENDGLFLFGKFSAVDAMFAPIVLCFDTYGYEIDGTARKYMDHIMTLPFFEEWVNAAQALDEEKFAESA